MIMFQMHRSLTRLLLASHHNVELNLIRSQLRHNLSQPTLTPRVITELLSRNQAYLTKTALPSFVKSIECNQLASNNPIEDRLRISSIHLPGHEEPTLMLGVFDGHGGGTTADLVSRRLFSYIAVSLYPRPNELEISNFTDAGRPENLLIDLHHSPKLNMHNLHEFELGLLSKFRGESKFDSGVVENLKTSFTRCDDDLSKEIQDNLINKRSKDTLHYYLSAAVSGCCAIVMVIHEGIAYLASTGDCRAVLGVHQGVSSIRSVPPALRRDADANATSPHQVFKTLDLNDEHNCDNVNEIRRLAASHPKSEQNTMIKHNRLLGHLMPFRAFGDFNYKWSSDLIKACGITRAYGSHIIPSSYETPPYLIVEPDVNPIAIVGSSDAKLDRFLVIASDGLWELFESSREVIETVVDHTRNACLIQTNDDETDYDEDYDKNCATHVLRSALQSSTSDVGLNPEELKRLYHLRLESLLTLPQAVVRNFRDDISIIVLKL